MPDEERFYFKILVSGDQLQGVGLRERIKSFCTKVSITGFIQNNPDGAVEIICKASKEQEEQLKSFLLKKVSEKLLIEGPKVEDVLLDSKTVNDLYQEFNKFQIKRESELKEMVWALQGAGHTFQLLAKIRVRNQIRGLIQELQELSLKASGSEKPGEKLPQQRLAHFLLASPLDDKITGQLEEIYGKIRLHNYFRVEQPNETKRREVCGEIVKILGTKDEKGCTITEIIEKAKNDS